VVTVGRGTSSVTTPPLHDGRGVGPSLNKPVVTEGEADNSLPSLERCTTATKEQIVLSHFPIGTVDGARTARPCPEVSAKTIPAAVWVAAL
jgi:hypothetical protein